MKYFLMKGVSLITITALSFMSNIALAVDDNTEPVLIDEVCETQTFVSGEGDGEVPVSFIHPAWTASIDGAVWVWSEDPLSDTQSEVVKTFTLNFNIEGIPADSELLIASDNSYKVTVNGNPLFVDISEDNHSSADSHTIPAANLLAGPNTIEFEVTNWVQEGGTQESNPAGLLYKLTVNCKADGIANDDDTPEEETCPIVYARVKFSKTSEGAEADGWKNWGANADLEPKAFVGGSDVGNIYADEAWFPLTNPDGSYIDDNDIGAYRDVPGVAIERSEGKIRFVLYGYHNELTGELGDKEYAAGVIQLSDNAMWTPGMQSPLDWSNDDANPRLHDPSISDSENPMDSRDGFVGTIDQYDHRFDRMKTWTPDRVAFALVATTGSDGFYATYDAPDCDLGNDDDNGDDTSDDDSIVDDGDDGGSGGGGSSSGSKKSSSNNNGGEVLGAQTENLCAFDIDTYMRLGYKNNGEQVKTLQWLLNKYTDYPTPLAIDGDFGPQTKARVEAFQMKYKENILSPWNIDMPTGIFFRTSLAWAQNLECPNEPVPIPTDLINWSASGAVVPPKI